MKFRALTDLYLPSGAYVLAGSILSDNPSDNPDFAIPSNWSPPTGAVDPLDNSAIQAYWNVGPKGLDDAEPSRQIWPWSGGRWTGIPVSPPKTFWVKIAPRLYQLNTGAFGPKDAV